MLMYIKKHRLITSIIIGVIVISLAVILFYVNYVIPKQDKTLRDIKDRYYDTLNAIQKKYELEPLDRDNANEYYDIVREYAMDEGNELNIEQSLICYFSGYENILKNDDIVFKCSLK